LFKRFLLAALLIVTAWIVLEWITWPDVGKLADQPPRTSAFMEERRQELRRGGKDDTISYTWVPYERISPSLRRAVLVAEDNDFYEHGGVDMKAMQEALKKDWEKKKMTQGGSTITQQLAKNLYLSSSRNPFRKLKEYFLARSLENHLTKKRILELYLNTVEMGERVYGAEAASQSYFKEPASALSPQQAALLAGSLPNPRVMNPGQPNKRLRWRQNMILSRMRRWGYLVERETLAAAPESSATDTNTSEGPPPSAAPAGESAGPPPSTTATAETTETTGTTAPPPTTTT
jgi:monofunctional biosynthetic peptidoglycan transglycosylase